MKDSSAAGKGREIVCPLLAMLAAAMGLQTATLTRIDPLTIHTTFVTGMLNKLAQSLSRWLFLRFDHRHKKESRPNHLRQESAVVIRHAAFMVAIWVLYLVGALCGTWIGQQWKLKALYLACVILLLTVVVDQVRPLSLEEEQEQSQP